MFTRMRYFCLLAFFPFVGLMAHDDSGVLHSLESAMQSMVTLMGEAQYEVYPSPELFDPTYPYMPPLEEGFAVGSGFFLAGACNGCILTNYHVVERMLPAKILLSDGRELEAHLLGKDEKTDLAVLHVDAENLPRGLRLGDSDALKLGQTVFAIGNPFGLNVSVSKGIVSGFNIDNLGLTHYDNFIQTDASINQGNSGGPLLAQSTVDSSDVHVIGINTAIYSPSGASAGIGYAIPSNDAAKVIHDIVHYGKVMRGWLGVMIGDVESDEMMRELGLPSREGSYIRQIGEDSPAQKFGLLQGDLIVGIDEKPISTSQELKHAIGNMAPNSVIKLSIIRDGVSMTVSVKVGEYPDDMQSQFSESALGFTMQNTAKGVLITDSWIEPLKIGDLILEVSGNIVQTTQEVEHVLRSLTGSYVLITVLRGDAVLHITLER